MVISFQIFCGSVFSDYIGLAKTKLCHHAAFCLRDVCCVVRKTVKMVYSFICLRSAKNSLSRIAKHTVLILNQKKSLPAVVETNGLSEINS